MGDFSKYRAAVISKAEYGDNEEPGFSTVKTDFPAIEEAGVAYGKTLTEIQAEDCCIGKPEAFHLGRIRDPEDPYNGSKVWVKAGAEPLYVGRILQHGVDGSSDYARPSRDTVPAACIVIVTVTAASVLLAIDNTVKHFVLGVEGPDLNGEDLPSGLLPYEFDTPMPFARWDELRNALVSLGVDADTIDNWYTNHPDATPRDLREAFKAFIK